MTAVAVNRLAAALVAAQKEMPAVEKTAKANYGKYATLDSLLNAVRPVLNKHGLAVVQFPAVSELGQPTLRTIIIHGESGEQLSAEMPILLPDDKRGMQALGAGITYARRYALGAALGIASEHDDDGASATSEAKPETDTQRATISDAQRRRLFAIAGEHDVDQDALKDIVFGVTGVKSTNGIPVDKYEAIVDLIEQQKVPF